MRSLNGRSASAKPPSTLASGSSQVLQVTGDFADQQGVILSPGYVQFQSSNDSIVSTDAKGVLRASGGGLALITVRHGDIQAENVIHAGIGLTAPKTDANDNELDVFPLSIDLPAGIGQRQIDVHTLMHGDQWTNLTAASTGTQYFISDPSVGTITADGLLEAKAVGTAIITVIHGGLQGTIKLEVQAISTGPVLATATHGAVTQDADGNTLMIGAGALAANAMVSIQAIPLSSINMPMPAPNILTPLAAVTVDISGKKADIPMQLAIKVNGAIDPATGLPTTLPIGEQVLFWQ